MLISCDLDYLRNHISILEKEQYEAQSFVDYLRSCHNHNNIATDGMTDFAFIKKHLQIANNELSHIRKKISFLELVIEKLRSAELTAEHLLDEAMGQLNSSTRLFESL